MHFFLAVVNKNTSCPFSVKSSRWANHENKLGETEATNQLENWVTSWLALLSPHLACITFASLACITIAHSVGLLSIVHLLARSTF